MAASDEFALFNSSSKEHLIIRWLKRLCIGVIFMNEKIDWMLGMTENMMSMTVKNMDKPMMKDMYSMTSAIMGNLNYMKMNTGMDMKMIDMMESMMRNMEMTMMNMDVNNDKMRTTMKSMMGYMVMMQLQMIMNTMATK
jgi:hypothetical protein